jgi:hypothetical protein
MTEVFEFVYTDCIYESAMATLSLHRTKKGAYKAMREFLEIEYANWYNEQILYGKDRKWGYKFGTHCAWAVRSIALKE